MQSSLVFISDHQVHVFLRLCISLLAFNVTTETTCERVFQSNWPHYETFIPGLWQTQERLDYTNIPNIQTYLSKLKTNRKIFSTIWPARSVDLNVTENVCLAVELKLHIETDVIKMQAMLANAESRNWRSLFIEYIENLDTSITHKLYSVIARKYFCTKY